QNSTVPPFTPGRADLTTRCPTKVLDQLCGSGRLFGEGMRPEDAITTACCVAISPPQCKLIGACSDGVPKCSGRVSSPVCCLSGERAGSQFRAGSTSKGGVHRQSFALTA